MKNNVRACGLFPSTAVLLSRSPPPFLWRFVQPLWKTFSFFIFSLSSHCLTHCNLAAVSTTALDLSGVRTCAPNSLTHGTHFCPYFMFLSVALNIINQLLKLASSLGLTMPFHSSSPRTLSAPLHFLVMNLSLSPAHFILLLISSSFLTSFLGNDTHFHGFYLTLWLMIHK